MRLYDTVVFDDAAKVRYTEDGYMTAAPRVARTGIQLYYGSELGMTGQDAKKVMKVYRSPDEVFHSDSLHSFAHRPFTDDHPPVQVTSDNWKDYATGQAGGEVIRDGEFIRVPMVLMDATAIKKYKEGKAEISVGYDCEIVFSAGTTPDGMAYDAYQKAPRANHFAVVDAARGGKQLRIGDAAGKVNVSVYADGLRAILDGKVFTGSTKDAEFTGYLADASKKEYPFIVKDGSVSLAALRAIKVDAIVKGDHDVQSAVDTMLSQIDEPTTNAVDDSKKETTTMTTKTITVDGISVEVVNDQAGQIIQKALDTAASLLKVSKDAYAKSEEENTANKKKMSEDSAKHATEMAAKDAEIVTLKKQAEDSAMTPAKLDQLVKDRAVVAGKARAILGDKLVVDGKTDSEIMGQVVSSKLGDAAKGWDANQVKVSFDTITAGVKPVDQGTSGLLDTAAAFSQPGFTTAPAAVEKAVNDRDQRLRDAWKTPAASV